LSYRKAMLPYVVGGGVVEVSSEVASTDEVMGGKDEVVVGGPPEGVERECSLLTTYWSDSTQSWRW